MRDLRLLDKRRKIRKLWVRGFLVERVFTLPGGQGRLRREQVTPSDTSQSTLHPLLEMIFSPPFSGEHTQETMSFGITSEYFVCCCRRFCRVKRFLDSLMDHVSCKKWKTSGTSQAGKRVCVCLKYVETSLVYSCTDPVHLFGHLQETFHYYQAQGSNFVLFMIMPHPCTITSLVKL